MDGEVSRGTGRERRGGDGPKDRAGAVGGERGGRPGGRGPDGAAGVEWRRVGRRWVGMLGRPWFVCALAVALLAAPARAQEGVAADAAAAGFVARAQALAADGETGPLTNGLHYFASNERDLDLVRAQVTGVGGVLVAVAADPAYILAGWAEPQAIVLVDLDPAIVQLHRIYAAFFAAAQGPAAFRRLWSEEGAADGRALLTEELRAVYEEARPAVAKRLADVERRFADRQVPWLLSDEVQYRRVAGLVRGGRAVALRGDFTRDGVVRAVGEALQAGGLRVGLLYLSNIEQYFLYTPGFRAGIAALPLAGAQVLRTLPGRPAGFEYILQRGEHFQAWAAAPAVRSVYRIRGFKKGEHLVSRTVHVVDPSRAPPRAATIGRP